ncbi:MAG: 50S ribosomal protein L11 methyltransferase [Betaproteobacteria bacterium]
MLRELTLLVAEPQAEALSDALLDLGALAVTVEDAQADTEHEAPLYGEPGMEPAQHAWPESRLHLLIAPGMDPQQLIAGAAEQCALPPPAVTALRSVEDADWVRLTQAQFPPTQVGARLWIVPTWHEPPDATALNIRIDPGVAFGTGTHPTTRLCLAWLEEQLAARARVLDYGCGSGILAIAAARLRAAQVHGVDIDEQAVRAAQHNSAANGVDPQSARYTASADLEPLDTPGGRFDVVLANILANPLKLLAPALLARVAPGGSLVLAGLLNRQAEELIALYRSIDEAVELSVWREMDGWSCLAGRRRSG